MDTEWRGASPPQRESSLSSLLHQPDMARLMETVMKDTMLGTIERHTEKIVSALLAISDQRIEEIAKNAQQAEERCNQMIASEREAREDMLKTIQRQQDDLRLTSTSQVEAVTQDIDSLRSLVVAEDSSRAMHELAPDLWRSRMERERKEQMAAIESLQYTINEQSARLETLSKKLTHEDQNATAGVQAETFTQAVDARMKEVGFSIDQLIKDFAGSLEAERAQRQESDRLVAVLTRDVVKYKEHLDVITNDMEALKGSAISPAMHNAGYLGKELEERLELRVREITSKFHNEQRQVIAGLQNAVTQLERALTRTRDTADSRNAETSSLDVQARTAPPVKRRISPSRNSPR